MTLHAPDLAWLALFVIAGCALCYSLVVQKMRHIAAERDLKIADQLAALDAAIQALETRLAERHPSRPAEGAASTSIEPGEAQAEGESIAGEIKAVIAAAATAVLRKNVAIKSVRSVPTPWSQQGRVLVMGSHNLSARK